MCYVVPPASPVVNGVAVGVSIALVVLVVLIVVVLAVVCMVPRFRRKMKKLFGKVTCKRWTNGNREMTMKQAEVGDNHPEDAGEAVFASTSQSQEKVHTYVYRNNHETILSIRL